MAFLGKLIGAVIGGPIGLIAGHGLDMQSSAARSAKREQNIQGEIIRHNTAKADTIAKQQSAENERALQRVSAGNVRAARRGVRGGLFGDSTSQSQYTVAQRLGG